MLGSVDVCDIIKNREPKGINLYCFSYFFAHRFIRIVLADRHHQEKRLVRQYTVSSL